MSNYEDEDAAPDLSTGKWPEIIEEEPAREGVPPSGSGGPDMASILGNGPDPDKHRSTLASTGLDMTDSLNIFKAKSITVRDGRLEHAKNGHMITLGYMAGRMVVLVWHPDRGAISLRPANEAEQKRYQARLKT